MSQQQHSTERFSDRAADYRQARPGYPHAAIDLLVGELGLGPGHVAADLGSGTGILARGLLDRGLRVFAVEPNAAMRGAAEEDLGAEPRFTSVAGRAEDTQLESESVDLVVGGQAFHWFDFEATRREVKRILRPGRFAAWFWNRRPSSGAAFLVDYESFLERWGKDYGTVRETYRAYARSGEFFAPGTCRRRTFEHHQWLDARGLEARVASSSYMPAPGAPTFAAMCADLERLFRRHCDPQTESVRLDYQTEVYFGQP